MQNKKEKTKSELPVVECAGCGVCCFHMGYPAFITPKQALSPAEVDQLEVESDKKFTAARRQHFALGWMLTPACASIINTAPTSAAISKPETQNVCSGETSIRTESNPYRKQRLTTRAKSWPRLFRNSVEVRNSVLLNPKRRSMIAKTTGGF